MMDKISLLVISLLTLFVGLYHIVFYRKLATKYAIVPRRPKGFFARHQPPYSESTCRVMNILAGLCITALGGLALIRFINKSGHEPGPIESLIPWILIIMVFGCMFALIVVGFVAFLRGE